MHSVFVYGLRQALVLAARAGAREQATEYAKWIAALTAAGRERFHDPAQRVFVSGPQRQVSYATQAWLILSGVAS